MCCFYMCSVRSVSLAAPDAAVAIPVSEVIWICCHLLYSFLSM